MTRLLLFRAPFPLFATPIKLPMKTRRASLPFDRGFCTTRAGPCVQAAVFYGPRRAPFATANRAPPTRPRRRVFAAVFDGPLGAPFNTTTGRAATARPRRRGDAAVPYGSNWTSCVRTGPLILFYRVRKKRPNLFSAQHSLQCLVVPRHRQ